MLSDIPNYEWLAWVEVPAELSDHHKRLAKLRSAFQDAADQRASLVSSLASEPVANIRAAAERVVDAELKVHRSTLAECNARDELLEQLQGSVARAVTQQEAELAKARERVTQALEAVGLGLNKAVAASNAGAARIQLQARVDEALEVRAVLTKLDRLRTAQRELVEVARAAREVASKTGQELRSAVERIVGTVCG